MFSLHLFLALKLLSHVLSTRDLTWLTIRSDFVLEKEEEMKICKKSKQKVADNVRIRWWAAAAQTRPTCVDTVAKCGARVAHFNYSRVDAAFEEERAGMKEEIINYNNVSIQFSPFRTSRTAVGEDKLAAGSVSTH